MVEGKMSMPQDTQAGVPQGPVLSPILYSLYINDTLQTPEIYLALFADDTFIYSTDGKEGYVIRKRQCGPSSMKSQCECWNIKINEDKLWAIYFPQ